MGSHKPDLPAPTMLTRIILKLGLVPIVEAGIANRLRVGKVLLRCGIRINVNNGRWGLPRVVGEIVSISLGGKGDQEVRPRSPDLGAV